MRSPRSYSSSLSFLMSHFRPLPSLMETTQTPGAQLLGVAMQSQLLMSNGPANLLSNDYEPGTARGMGYSREQNPLYFCPQGRSHSSGETGSKPGNEHGL